MDNPNADQSNPEQADVKPSMSSEGVQGTSAHQPETSFVLEDPQPVHPSTKANITSASEDMPSGDFNEQILLGDEVEPARMIVEDGDFAFANTSESDRIAELSAEKANYERVNFNINAELTAAKEKLIDLSSQRQQLLEQVKGNAHDMAERTRLFQQMEASRNELAMAKMNLDGEVLKLKQEKEERDNAIRALVKEKQVLATETVSLKDELQSAVTEKSTIQIQMSNLEQEKRNLAFERDRSKADREMFAESKRWFMKEIADRDNKLSMIRIELSGKEIQWQNERMNLTNELKKLQGKVEDLQESLTSKQEALDRSVQMVETSSSEHRQEVLTLETELQSKVELVRLYKESMEKAETCAAELGEQMKAREELVRGTRAVLEEVREEMDNERNEHFGVLAGKDSEIAQLKDELEKANEMLKNKHAVSINVTEEEIANLSPAAAETSKILKGGMTLTSMMREQARLAGELAAEREKSRQIEATMREVVEEIENNAPQLMNQKQQLEQLFDENTKLRDQLEVADDNRRRLEGNKDAAHRELAFTRAELEKYQRDHMDLAKKHQHLLFVLEKERMVRDTDSPPPSEEDDRQLYDDIGQLQKRNMQLESELASERASAAQTALAAQNAELEQLRRELDNSKSSEMRLATQLDQLNSAFTALQDQSSRLSALVEDNVSAAEARDCRLRAEEATAETRAGEMKIARLEEAISFVKEEKSSMERFHADSIAASQNIISELKMTNTKLQVQFDQQKQINDAAMKDLESAQRERDRLSSAYEKFLSSENELAKKLHQMSADLMKMQEQCSSAKIDHRLASEELERAKSNVSHLEAQLQLYKDNEFKDKQMMGSLSELTTRLSRIESERQGKLGTQLEVLQMEHQSLKSTMARTNDQLTQTKNEAKAIQVKQEQQLAVYTQRLAEKEEQLNVSEKELAEMRTRLATIQSQYTAGDSTDGMSPERLKKECQQLKNRVQYLESQCEEIKSKLAAAEVEVSRKEEEMQRMVDNSGKMETGLIETQKMGAMERSRLENRAQAAEDRVAALSLSIAELRSQVDAKEAEITELKMAHLQTVNELQQRVDIQEQNLRDAENKAVLLKESLQNVNQQLEKTTSELSEKTNEIDSLTQQHSDTLTKADIAESRLNNKQNELFTALESARMAEESRAAAELALSKKSEQYDAAEGEWKRSSEENSQRLQDVLRLYDEVVSKMSVEGQSGSSDELAALNPDLPQAVIQSQQSVMQFLRDEKDAAVNRAMTSEVEMMRLRAETREVLSSRDELVSKLRELEVKANMAESHLVEKAELMKKVEQMMSTQQQLEQLRTEKEKIQKLAVELQDKVRQNSGIVEDLRTNLQTATLKCTSLTSEIGARNRELESLRKDPRLASTGQNRNHLLLTELEELKSKLERTQKELGDAQKHAVAAETSSIDFKSKFEQTKTLAIRYRKDVTVLKAQLEAKPVVGQNQQQQALIATLKEQVEGLNTRITLLTTQVTSLTEEKTRLQNEVESKTAEIQEGQFRLTLLTSKVSKNDAAMAKLRDTINEKTKQIEELEARQEVVAATPQPSSANVTAVTQLLTSATSLPAASAVASPVAAKTQASNVSVDSNVSVVSTAVSSQPTQKMAFNSSASQILSMSASATPTGPGAQSPTKQQVVTPVFGGSSRVPAPSLFGGQSQQKMTGQVPATSSAPIAASSPIKQAVVSSAQPPSSPVTFSFASSTLKPGSSLFGRSAPPVSVMSTSTSFSCSSANSTLEDTLVQGSDKAAGQSCHVSGSLASMEDVVEDTQNDSAGESRDSTLNVPVSSTDGNRKRPAASNEETKSEAKRQRDSPNETVTSSEEQRPVEQAAGSAPNEESNEVEVETVEIAPAAEREENVLPDEEGGEGQAEEAGEENLRAAQADVDFMREMEQDQMHEEEMASLSDEDAGSVDRHDEENGDEEEDEEEHGEDESDDDIIPLGDNLGAADEVMMMARQEAADQSDDEEEDEEEELEENAGENDDTEVVVVSDSEGEEDSEGVDDDGDVGFDVDGEDDEDDEEVLAAEADENSRSQPSLEGAEDREAASAVEEADDEGRASADDGRAAASESGGSVAQASGSNEAPRVRAPIVFNNDRDDQCSSSNESGSVPQAAARRGMRHTARRGGAAPRGLYQARRGRGK